MDQPKVERLLRIMKMLTGNTSLTIEEIAGQLSISPRSVYRYIDTFRDAGFVIKKKNNCFRLDKSSPYFKDISSLIHFSREEAYILKSAHREYRREQRYQTKSEEETLLRVRLQRTGRNHHQHQKRKQR